MTHIDASSETNARFALLRRHGPPTNDRWTISLPVSHVDLMNRPKKKAAQYLKSKKYKFQWAQVIYSFKWLYERACKAHGMAPLSPTELYRRACCPTDFNYFLEKVGLQQPAVLGHLIREKETFWMNNSFDAAATLFFTSHSMAYRFNTSTWTRAWYHPSFSPGHEDFRELAKELELTNIVHDEIESDAIVKPVARNLADFIVEKQSSYPDWRNRATSDRQQIYVANRIPLKPYCNVEKRT